MRSSLHPGSLVATLCAVAAALTFATAPCRADLDEYVKKPDPAFAWKQVDVQETPAGKITALQLTSQVWQGAPWVHSLRIYEAGKPTFEDAALLFINGGSTGNKPGPDMELLTLTLSKLCGARVALLSQVPNQPLMGGKKEDDLIAETFVHYLKTKDEEWPLLFPMTKSAVKAMDAVQAWAKQDRQVDVKRFVVTGASKRGWTTWLTSAVDDRVVALAPMVIVMLNLGAQGPNQLDVWGDYSEQIQDYVRRGLMEDMKTGEGTKLWRMVDPYTYRDRLADKPKFLLNGANDRYWTLNALDFYWDGLPGEKYLLELPNAGHGLNGDRSWVINGLAAFFRSSVAGKPMPKLDWKMEPAGKAQYTLKINADPAPKSARLWTADSASRDFRESKWVSTPLEPAPIVSAVVSAPESGGRAIFADLEYDHGGLPYHLTTTFFEPGLDAKVKKKETKPAAAAVPVGASSAP
ncbi:PhoPQ-activated pathogenicity-related family protein [Paludisphaera rhizosphaerae]|uniref:PhoPQ-activated pathogenicity-related family protein n=1 Tax=Paludisphaera rhizosphaerae TaxID=2711216 RepID=UPI0013EBA69C|nr:PhoPQ-activated protein PqaA family protein [Paludisphaera rhizosphaerae]